jgi:hypothetical protein
LLGILQNGVRQDGGPFVELRRPDWSPCWACGTQLDSSIAQPPKLLAVRAAPSVACWEGRSMLIIWLSVHRLCSTGRRAVSAPARREHLPCSACCLPAQAGRRIERQSRDNSGPSPGMGKRSPSAPRTERPAAHPGRGRFFGDHSRSARGGARPPFAGRPKTTPIEKRKLPATEPLLRLPRRCTVQSWVIACDA